MIPHWYSDFLARRPYLLIVLVAVFCIACTIVSIIGNDTPDFSDPTLGFETRDTIIGRRRVAWENLLRETESNGSLVEDPRELEVDTLLYRYSLHERHHDKHRRRHRYRNLPVNQKRQHHGGNKKKKKKNRKTDLQIDPSASTFDIEGEHSSVNNTEWIGDTGIFHDFEITNTSDSNAFNNATIQYGHNVTYIEENEHREQLHLKVNKWNMLREPMANLIASKVPVPAAPGYFCDAPSKSYSHFGVHRTNDESLFDLRGLLAICRLQDMLAAVTDYTDYCEMQPETEMCCRPWSLVNYAALLANKSSCHDLMDEDVDRLHSLFITCFEYFYDLRLNGDCSQYHCYAPPECTQNNVVFNSLHFLADENFIKPNDSLTNLKYSLIFMPIAQTTKILPLFYEWEKMELTSDGVRIVAMDLGLENALFDELLVTDWWLVALGGVFVMVCIWMYTSSVFVTVMTCIAIIFSLGLAYFCYTFVFNMAFFPYMNLLALVVIIGIGSDDAFIFVKVWECVLAEKYACGSASNKNDLADTEMERTETVQNIMAQALNHAIVSMFVTSLTTAAAFYASYISSITAIKCFGIFAGTAVCANFLLMITWLPASVSLMECNAINWECGIRMKTLMKMLHKSIERFCNLFESIISRIVISYAILWIIIFTAIGALSLSVVLYYPGIQLPETSHFQLFATDHPFEVYNIKWKYQFRFERLLMAYDKLPLRFVWGVEALDDGDHTDPFTLGNLHFDDSFNISSKVAQLWLRQFCQHIREQPFYEPATQLLMSNCFIENFITCMDRLCIDAMDGRDRSPCCKISQFPFEPDVFDYCLPHCTSSLYSTPSLYFTPSVAGPKFHINRSIVHDIETNGKLNDSMTMYITGDAAPKVKAVVIDFLSNISFTLPFRNLSRHLESVEEWFNAELLLAPPELANGWFISELKFYDVQYVLTHSTQLAIAVSMSVAFVVVLMVTLNVLVSFYAIITVTLTIFCVVAILILIGWKLNILESVAVSTAIGLAVDFSLHYGIHYRMSPISERRAAIRFALSRIIGPTAMAAVTTSFGGILMMASKVLPYIQIGVFLLVVMTVSWLYATFFLSSLLYLAGPQHGFMQFHYPNIRWPTFIGDSNRIYSQKRKPPRFMARDHLLDPPSLKFVGAVIYPETHELEVLTSNSNYIKTISGKEPNLSSIANRLTSGEQESDLQSLRSDSLA